MIDVCTAFPAIGRFRNSNQSSQEDPDGWPNLLDGPLPDDGTAYDIKLGFPEYTAGWDSNGFSREIIKKYVQLLPTFVPRIRFLDVTSCFRYFENAYLAYIAAAFPEITSLNLSVTGIDGGAATTIASFRQLESLVCRETELSQSFMDAAGNLPKLAKIDIGSKRAGSNTTEEGLLGFQQFRGFPCLRQLTLAPRVNISWYIPLG